MHTLREQRRYAPALIAIVTAALAALSLLLFSPGDAAAEQPPEAAGVFALGDGAFRRIEVYGPAVVESVTEEIAAGPSRFNAPLRQEVVAFFTDCDNGGISTSCGGAPGHWAVSDSPVAFCTHQFNRPGSISADLFRDTVAEATEFWVAREVGVGLKYVGDCTEGDRWADDNGANEIGFDDSRNVVTAQAAGISRGSWVNIPAFGLPLSREFREFDIILDEHLDVPEACFRSVVFHEMGHAIGFGHSDVELDLMSPTFNPNNIATCHDEVSDDEQARLEELYGVNRSPTLQPVADRTVSSSAGVSLLIRASDPEGDPLTFEWRQLSGPPIAFASAGPAISFVAPEALGSVITLEVQVRDRFLHRSVVEVTITVDESTEPPSRAPGLASFLPAADNSGVEIGWTPSPGAVSYEFCSTPADTDAAPTCRRVSQPKVKVTWDTIIGTVGSPAETRVFTTGARKTTLAGCNSAGCTKPGLGPLAGGLRWPAWNIDFDYVAFTLDVASFRWTIISVNNLSDEPRRITYWLGTPDDRRRQQLARCGLVDPGQTCFKFLQPSDPGHFEILTIVTDREGTPTTEHRIRIR